MPADIQGRWPPVYSAEDLSAVIRDLTRASDFDAKFWSLVKPVDGDVCQGDVISLNAEVPVLDADGEIAEDGVEDRWLVLGNTCDFARSYGDVRWTQIAPIVAVGTSLTVHDANEHRAYKHSRQFYLPPWPGGEGEHSFADLTRPVTLDKAAFSAGTARVAARMQYPAWVLLHSCLIRFLARDDGRHEAA